MATLWDKIKERVTMHTTGGRSTFHPNALVQVLKCVMCVLYIRKCTDFSHWGFTKVMLWHFYVFLLNCRSDDLGNVSVVGNLGEGVHLVKLFCVMSPIPIAQPIANEKLYSFQFLNSCNI